MKKQPKAVYIIENGGYTELTYEEFRRREQICPLYADKLFLPLYGRLMEVSKEDYMEFYRAKRRQKYLDERSADNGDFSYDMLTTDEFSGEDNSPTIEESILQKAVMTAIMETANQNTEVLRTLKLHIGMGLEGEKSNDNSLDLQVRIAEIDAEFRKMIDRVSTETVEAFDEETATRLMNEKSRLQQQLDNIADAEQRRENAKSRLDDIYTILDGIKNHPIEYDDQIVRQLLECIVVDSKEQVTVIFKGGLKSVQPLTE